MTTGRSDLVEIDADFRRMSDSGDGMAVWTGDKDPRSGREKWVWLPTKLVQRNGDTFTMPEWLAKEKGLI